MRMRRVVVLMRGVEVIRKRGSEGRKEGRKKLG